MCCLPRKPERIRFQFQQLAQSVWCLITDKMKGVQSPAEARDISSNLCVQTSSEAHRALIPVDTGGLSRS
jgi:hypothetical protein